MGKRAKLKDGEDREVTRKEIKKLTGLSDSRLSRLIDAIPPIGKRGHDVRGYHKVFSLRMVLQYIESNPVNKKRQAAGKLSHKNRKEMKHGTRT